MPRATCSQGLLHYIPLRFSFYDRIKGVPKDDLSGCNAVKPSGSVSTSTPRCACLEPLLTLPIILNGSPLRLYKRLVHLLYGDVPLSEMPLENHHATLLPAAPSEYERYLVDLESVLQGLAQFDGESGDLDFIAQDTGINRQHLAWLATALNFEKQSQNINFAHRQHISDSSVPAEVYYGWFRQGLPTESSALWATPIDTLTAALGTSIEQKIVPPIRSSMSDTIRERIEQIKLDLLNEEPTISDARSDLSPDDPQLVNQGAEPRGFYDDEVGEARTLRLAALTGGHLPIMQALQLRLQQAGENGSTLQPLAALAPDEWLDLAYTYGTPEGSTITPEDYADSLSASIERQYPTAALAEHLRDARRLSRQNAFAEIGSFLRANPSFDIVTANLNVLAEQAELQGHYSA